MLHRKVIEDIGAITVNWNPGESTTARPEPPTLATPQGFDSSVTPTAQVAVRTGHACAAYLPRCGHEDRCEYGSWADRHPVLSTIAGLFTITLMSMTFSVYPVAAITMTAFASVWADVRLVMKNQQRRPGLVGRADWEHAAMMVPAPPVPDAPAPPTNPPTMLPRHVMNTWPTYRMQTGQQR